MSGPKDGLIVPGLVLAIRATGALIELAAAANAARLRRLQTAEHQDAKRKTESLRQSIDTTTIPQTVATYAPQDAAHLTEQRKQTLELIATGNRESDLAESLRREAEELRGRSRQLRSNGTLSQVEGALRMEREAENKLQKALEHSGRAKNAFDSAMSTGNRFTQNVDNIQRIAAEREAAAKIAEENQRRAVSSNSEIDGLATSIHSLNHEKFAPGEYRALSTEIETFRRAFTAKNFAEAAKIGETLGPRLRTFQQRASSLQMAFETAQTAAKNALDAAKQEIAPLDKSEMIRWTGEDELVHSAYSRLDAAITMIDAEQFSEAEIAIAASLNDLRRIAKTAEGNQAASGQRAALADVIMNALYEQGYDAPTYYYMRQKSDGSDVEFSDLTIFAKAPGNRGDMRMNIDLAGKVKLEVEGIAEGEETVCHQLVQDLQKGVGDEMDFQITDWGRAANVDPNAKVVVRQQTQTQEKDRERQGR